MNIAYIANPHSQHDCKWINHFAKKNHVILICQSQFDLKNTLLSDNIKVYPILPIYSVIKFWERKKAIKEARAILKQENISILHSMYGVPNALWGNQINSNIHITTTRGSDILVDYPNWQKAESFKNRLTNQQLSKQFEAAYKNARFVTSTSTRQIEGIQTFSKTDNVNLIRTGVDTSQFEVNESSVLKNDNIRIFSPRSMHPNYNIDVIIKAIHQFKNNTDKNIKLVLIDDHLYPGYSEKIHQLTDDLGMRDHIEFLSFLDKKALIQEYEKADIITMIPESDGSPNSGIESLLMKRPLVMGAVNYDHDLFDRSVIFHLSINNEENLLNELKKIIDLNKNILEERLIKGNEIAIEKASLNNSLTSVDALYQKMI